MEHKFLQNHNIHLKLQILWGITHSNPLGFFTLSVFQTTGAKTT